MRGWGARFVRLVAAGMAALAVAGCGLLFPSYPMPEDLGAPPLAVYRHGQATITLGDGTRIVLDEVAADSNLVEALGATVHWTGADGWHVRLMDASPDLGWGSYAYLQLDRIEDGNHWTTWDGSRCIIDVDLADETGVRGRATCKGLQWSDALNPFPEVLSSPSTDGRGPKFDAEIEFEAFPPGDAA
jgi:hypothetical protein